MIKSLNIFPNLLSQPISFGLCCLIWGGFGYFLFKRLKSKRNIQLALQFINAIENSDIIGRFSIAVRHERKNADKSRAHIEEQFNEQIVKTITAWQLNGK